jgi:ferredoxin
MEAIVEQSLCVHHLACRSRLPTIFGIDRDGLTVVMEHNVNDPNLVEMLYEVSEACPVLAIELHDS